MGEMLIHDQIRSGFRVGETETIDPIRGIRPVCVRLPIPKRSWDIRSLVPGTTGVR